MNTNPSISYRYNSSVEYSDSTQITLVDICIIVSGFACLSTLFTKLNPVSSFVNILLIAIYVIFAVLAILRKANTFSIVALFFVLVITGLDLVFSNFNYSRINDFTYLPFWIINLLFYSRNLKIIKKRIFKMRSFFIVIVIIWNVSVFISLFLPSSFVVGYTGRSFVSFCGTEHRFAATALFCIVITFVYYLSTKTIDYLLLLVLPIISIFISNTRTYVAVLLLLLLFITIRNTKKKNTSLIIMLVGIVLFVLVIVYYSNLKLEYGSSWALENKGVLFVLTSGRNEFWTVDLHYFFQSPFINILFGNGSNFIYDINAFYLGTRIWAHNDYINVLCANGLFGLSIYFLMFFYFVLSIRKESIGRGLVTSKIFLVFYVIIIFINAMFNMVYVYTVANLLTPIIGIIMVGAEKRIENNKAVFYFI